ncbi:MAG: 5-(carboxyamino)imidazole ribonucleotide mutase [Thermosediminibacterales bacterium]|nr:5-(carboxyamino)imidazole ribonucleotide mutase [Thermosediminibacterales bacterium]MDK2835326.1 5-(carboxyamino)imidazole ribonucleotide mutase [Thermosediminibacterales bacterium]
MEKPLVGVVMGSDSDFPVMRECIEVLRDFNVGFEVSVISAHRTPEEALEYAKTAEERGIKVLIAGAGKAAHLPGVMAAMTVLPVIGVPIKSSTMDGLDSLLSIVQMPGGIPVATVAINGAKNAGLLAVQILSVTEAKLKEKLKQYRIKMKQEVRNKDKKIKKEVGLE